VTIAVGVLTIPSPTVISAVQMMTESNFMMKPATISSRCRLRTQVTNNGGIMLKRIKYKLLRWLLDDICLKSECQKCRLSYNTKFCGSICHQCLEGEVFSQANKAWGLEGNVS